MARLWDNPDRQPMNTSWQSLLQNTERLDALVDSMAKLMAKVLHIRNFEINDGKKPLGRALYEEKESFPTRAQLDSLEEVKHATAFVRSAETLCNSLNGEARIDRNVVLGPYSNGQAFKSTWCFLRPRGRKKSKLRVGGVSGALYLDAKREIFNWLLECDRAMCIAYKDLPESDDENANIPASLWDLASNMADAAARRITYMPVPSDDEAMDLSTASLQSRAGVEVTRTALQAEEWQRTDLIALESFHLLAKCGGKSTTGREVLEHKLSHLQYVLQKPPVELGLKGVNASRMKLELLAKACAPDVDIDVRCAIAEQWHAHHGACAATAARQAIQQINLWNSTPPRQAFIQVLQPPPLVSEIDVYDTKPPQGPLMPKMPFVHVDHPWRFVPTTEQRTGLDLAGRRIVRLTSMMLQLLGHGAIERGVVSSHLVIPVVMQGIIEARYVMDLLRVKNETCSMGTNLLKFCEDVSNYESHLSDEVGDAMAYVSAFSTNELISIFHNQSPAIRLIMDEFTIRTRIALGNYQSAPIIPKKYTAFTYDAMAIVLPMIQQRRELMCVPVNRVANPVACLLQRLPVVKGWHPLRGTLRLTNDDLKEGSGLLRLVLAELASRKVLVEYKRPYLGNQKHGSKMAYVFDTVQLVAMLGGGVQ